MGKAEEKKLVIVGASGHGKVIADIAVLNGYHNISFLDDDASVKECAGFPVIGTTSELDAVDGDIIIAIGNSSVREKMQSKCHPITLIHPNAIIGRNVIIGEGSVVMAGAVINPETRIGKGCIINTCASVDHDCVLDDFVHVAVGAHVCGTVKIGRNTWVGAGSIVSNNISVGEKTTLGAGAVVVRDIPSNCTAVGIPARPI